MSTIREKLADFVYPEGADRRNTLERLANTDSLTGLPNARALAMALPAAEADSNIRVVVIDLDGFKQVNDLAGHEEGDVCLQGWAKWILMCCLDSQRRAFRRGGDEFVVLTPLELEAGIVADLGMVRFHHTSGVVISASVASGDTFAEADKRMLQKKAQKGVLR